MTIYQLQLLMKSDEASPAPPRKTKRGNVASSVKDLNRVTAQLLAEANETLKAIVP